MEHQHYALFGSDLTADTTFIKDLLKGTPSPIFKDLEHKKGVLFSQSVLTKFIKEEAIHDDYTLTDNQNRSIRTFSSGEQRKALLNYVLSKQPDFLIVDTVFDMLDTQSVSSLLTRLIDLSKQMPMIQIFKRKSDILPFISAVYEYNKAQIHFIGSVSDYSDQAQNKKLELGNGTIPKPLTKIEIEGQVLVECDNVSVSYEGKAILNTINWKVKKGEFWQLKGPNGSGKTTLLTMITGDNPKAYGQKLYLFGQKRGSGESVWDIKKKIGYITPAMTSLFKGRHTLQNMIISGLYDSVGLYVQPTFFDKKLANLWIEILGLADLKNMMFGQLTQEKQCLVLIARAMIKCPPLLILDEPTQGLDDFNASVLVALINKISEETDTAILYVSHKKEAGLMPKKIAELIPKTNGSSMVINALH